MNWNSSPTRSISSDSEGTKAFPACMITGARRTIPSCSSTWVKIPRPAAACSRTGRLRTSVGIVDEKGPRVRCALCGDRRHSRTPRRAGPAEALSETDSPSTTRDLRIASAKIASLLGRPRSLSRVASSRSCSVDASRLGDMRSGSGNTASKPMAAAPSAVRRVTRSATTVRGHGHCPISLRLASSMSTMTTGRAVCSRGRRT